MAGASGSWGQDVVDSHIHLSAHHSGGLENAWLPAAAESLRRDWTEADYRAAVGGTGALRVKQAIFVQCFNAPPVEEARWVLRMVDDPASVVAGLTAEIAVQQGAAEVRSFLDQLRGEDGRLPKGLKGARVPFFASQDNAPDACLAPAFLKGLAELGRNGLLWEFCVNPFSAPHLAACCAQLPGMTFVVDHLAHNGNSGGEMELWGPAMDALGALPNVFAKAGGAEEWGVENPEDYLDRAVKAFGFDRLLYESNWFVSQAVGDGPERGALLLQAACERAGAGERELRKVFAENARRVYSLDTP